MFTTTSPSSNNTAILNLQRLYMLRWVSITGQAASIAIASLRLQLPLPLQPLILALSLLVLWNIYTGWRLRQNRPVSDREFFFQLTVDVAVLTVVLYYSGGATNPFTWVFLLPVIIAATVLPRRLAWGMALLTTSCYTLLIEYFQPLNADPSDHTDHMQHMSHGSDFMQHVYGMWFGYVMSASMVVLFVAGMANTLRERDRILARAREQALRDEQLVALGALAAGAAHELGTPLATMAIVTGDLQQDYRDRDNPELNSKLKIIQEQIGRCKQALSVMSASAGEVRADAGKLVAVDAYLQHLVDDWVQLRPDIKLYFDIKGEEDTPGVVADHALTQALTNILNNAADASPNNVELSAQWNAQQLLLNICDRGPGLDAETSASLGKTLVTTKQHGLGMGLFLAHSTIERMGGDVQLFNREGGGVCTQIRLYLAPLRQ